MRLGSNGSEGERGLQSRSSSLTFGLRRLSRLLRSLLLSCATDSAVSAASTPESVFQLRSFSRVAILGCTWQTPGCAEDVPQSARNAEKEVHIVLRSDVLILRIGRRGLELGWNSHRCDSGFLDLAFEWDCIIDDPLGNGTHRPGVLIDRSTAKIHERERVMTTEEQILKMKKAIAQAIKVMGDRFGSTEQDVARAIQELKVSMQGASEPSPSVNTVPGSGSQT